jgi:hypothetical protein
MNFGLSASGTLQQNVLFETHGQPLLAAGDTVLLMFFGNDFNDNVNGSLHAEVRDGQIRLVGPTKQLAAKSVLKDRSYLINLIVYTVDRIGAVIKRRHEAQWMAAWTTLGDQSPEIIVAKHYLRAFRDACAEKQARLVVAYIPERGELNETGDADEKRRAVEQAYRRAFFQSTQALGIQTIDLLPHLLAGKKANGQVRLTFFRDEHWNASGHALAARILSDFILNADQERG